MTTHYNKEGEKLTNKKEKGEKDKNTLTQKEEKQVEEGDKTCTW